MPSLMQARDDRRDDALCILRIAHRDALGSGFKRRIIVAARKEGVADKEHLLDRNAQHVAQLADAVGLVDSRTRHVDRGRSAETNGELRQRLSENRLNRFALGKVWIPLGFFFERRLLPQSRVGDLGAAIFDALAPALRRLESRLRDGLLERGFDLLLLARAQVIGVELLPAVAVLEKLRPRRRQDREILQLAARRKTRQHLRLELRKVAARDNGDPDHGEQPAEQRGHLVVQRRLAERQGAVQIEYNQPLHEAYNLAGRRLRLPYSQQIVAGDFFQARALGLGQQQPGYEQAEDRNDGDRPHGARQAVMRHQQRERERARERAELTAGRRNAVARRSNPRRKNFGGIDERRRIRTELREEVAHAVEQDERHDGLRATGKQRDRRKGAAHQ